MRFFIILIRSGSVQAASRKEQDILEHWRRLESICNCEVTHLRHVGAFILSYDNKDHTPADTLNLGIENGIAVEDRVISTMGGSVRPILTNYHPKLTNGMPDDPFFRYQWPLKHLGNGADINAVLMCGAKQVGGASCGQCVCCWLMARMPALWPLG